MALSYNEVKSALDAVTAETGGKFVPFDASYYVSTYIGVTDVANPVGSWSGDMLEHYTLHGAAQNFNPNAWFDAGFYRGRYPDAAGLSGADALVHYAKYGVNEGRAGSAALTNFNAARYLSENPDIVPYVEGNLDDFGGSMSNGALAHYVKFGAGEQRLAYDLGGNLLPFSLTPESSTIAGVAADGVTTVSLNTNGGETLLVGPAMIDGEDASILRLVGDADIRIDMTNTANQVRGIDLNGDGTLATNGVENNVSGAGVATFKNFNIVDAYARNPLNTGDRANNFTGDIDYSGVGYDGDGVSTDGNIVLGGLGADNILAGIGNDFLAGGGVAVGIAGLPTSDDRFYYEGGSQGDVAIADFLSGGRNADFFFGQFASLDTVDGVANFYDGGTTADDTSAGNGESSQDTDWLLLEIGDDEEYGEVALRMGQWTSSEDPSDGPQEYDFTYTVDYFAGDGYVAIGDGKRLRGILDDVENVDASGNLYGFLDGYDVELGGRRLDNRDTSGEVNYGIGSSGQLRIYGSEESNKLIGGYDNDFISGGEGNDLLMGGNMQFFKETVAGGVTNPNLAGITNDGRDELVGGYGDDDILFEADGGIYEGDSAYNDASPYDDSDKLWLTDYLFGTSNAAEMTTDGVVRFDLMTGSGDWWDSDDDGYDDMFYGGLDNAAGYGGADEDAATGRFTADQTNYVDGVARTQVQDFAAIDATGLGAIDFLAAGSNDPELNFTNQQNFWGYNGDMTLRGHLGDNGLYAGAGDDVIEGRHGNDSMMGGQGNDDFYFSIDGDTIDGQDANDGYGNNEEFYLSGDGVDVIRRKVDANGDGLWDEDDEGNGLWGQDFGLDQDSTVGQSVLQIRVEKVGGNLPGDELDDVVNFVSEITTGVKDNGVFTPVTLNTAAIKAATTYQGLVDAINAALDDTAFGADLQASLDDDGVTIFIADAKGRELADSISEVAGAGVIVNQKANTQTENVFQFGAPEITVAQDRLIYKAYEDRRDNEGVDDDAVTGSTVTLGEDAYAEDLVVSFDADGTRIAEDQYYNLRFTNLTTEDVVKVAVNGVTYQLQVGVAVNGTQVDGEDGVYDSQADVQANFLRRFADFINSFMDDDTAAGQVGATYWGDGQTIGLYQVAYDGEETVFMKAPVVTLSNASGGEPASVSVTNDAQHEVHLLDFDGRDNNLNSDNVLFWGQEMVNRAVLETSANAGGVVNGSDALVINGGTLDDLAGIAHNLATDDELFTDADDDDSDDAPEIASGNFVVHGDDYILGGNGDDTINGETGDDRVRGSAGNDTLDGGGDWYFVRRVGETKGTATKLNAYEAQQLDEDGDVLDIYLLEQSESADSIISGSNFVPYFRDTLIYHQADFTPGTSRFTITLNDYAGTGDDIVFDNGGAGTVGVDNDGNGVIESDNVSTFQNFENIRTVSGVGLAVAGANGGQGRDTLDVNQLSDDAEVGVYYDMTGDGAGGNVYLIEDPDNKASTENNTTRLVIKVDGVENVLFGDGNDALDIDETEAAKDNVISGDLGTDVVTYRNDFADEDNEGDDEPTITIFVESSTNTDLVQSTEGRVGSVVATDTLNSIETVTLAGNTAAGFREDDTINVEALSAGATVNYVNGKISNSSGSTVLTINNIVQMEYVVADGDDTVIVANGNVMSDNARADSWDERDDIVINSYLNYDLLDGRGTAPERLSVADLRAIASGTADTADTDDIPEVRNFSLFNFLLGQDTDRVDYSNETGTIAAVVNFNEEDDTQYVMVDHNASQSHGSNGGYKGADDRIDRLVDVEEVVASQGESILDLTNSDRALAVQFSRLITTDGGRDVHSVQLADLETDEVISRNYLEYRDNDIDDDNNGSNAVTPADPADVFALWNTIEDGDSNSRVEFTDAETGTDDTPAGEFSHYYYGRGGLNEANYNELTRSIVLELNVVEYDENNPAGSGLVTGDVSFTNGIFGQFIGDMDYLESYSAQNEIAAGALRVEASQDAEDIVGFAPGLLNKLFILGEVLSGSDQITVRIGSGDEANSVELTGFEYLADSAEDDVYDMRDLERVQDNLNLIDNPTDDRDVIAVGDDAVAYDGGPAALTAAADTISLEVLNDVFGFDFDVLDITGVEEEDLIIVGDDDDQDGDTIPNWLDTDYIGVGDVDGDGANDVARDTPIAPVDGDADDVVVGDLDLIASISGFQDIWLTDASIASNGSEFVLDITGSELEDDSSALFATNALGLNFSLVTSGVTVSVNDLGAVGAYIVGSTKADTITGGSGADYLEGGAGNDTLDGGTATEVRTVELSGILDPAADAVTITMGTGGVVLTVNENAAPVDNDPTDGTLDVLAGSGADAVGAALASLIAANLTAINGVVDAFDTGVAGVADDVDLLSATYDAGTNLLTFTFQQGVDVEVGDAIVVADTDGGTFAASTDTPISEGGDGGIDTFGFAATGAANGTDTINGFIAGVGGDVLDFTAFFDGTFQGLHGPTVTTGTNSEGTNPAQEVVRFDNLGTALTAAVIAAETGDDQALDIDGAAGARLVVLEINSTATGEDAYVWMAYDANQNGVIVASEVTLVGILTDAGDSAFVAGNFVG